jgi:NAD(P)-dependent dehydrogenase (short-subunit alcohol dehydrogenase family)
MQPRHLVITGATSGLGLAAVRSLARHTDIHIIAGIRATSRTETLTKAIPSDRLTLLPLDVADLTSVRAFAAQVIASGQKIDALALNAGLQFSRGDLRSPQGFELTFATNHLGHFLLYTLLAPVLAEKAPVVTISSGTQNPNETAAKRFGFRDGVWTSAAALAQNAPDPTLPHDQQGRDAYAASKTANVLFARGMPRHAPHTFIAFEPGAMPGTGLARTGTLRTRLLWHTLARLILPHMGGSTPRRSGRVLARLLTTPGLPPGSYTDFTEGVGHPHPLTADPALQDELIATSRALTRI